MGEKDKKNNGPEIIEVDEKIQGHYVPGVVPATYARLREEVLTQDPIHEAPPEIVFIAYYTESRTGSYYQQIFRDEGKGIIVLEAIGDWTGGRDRWAPRIHEENSYLRRLSLTCHEVQPLTIEKIKALINKTRKLEEIKYNKKYPPKN